MDYTIFYPTPLAEIDPKDDNMDVCVTFADGQYRTFVFATPQNLYRLMQGGGVPYLEPGLPFLFVEELTDANIRACLDSISDDRAAKNLYGAQVWNLMESWTPEQGL